MFPGLAIGICVLWLGASTTSGGVFPPGMGGWYPPVRVSVTLVGILFSGRKYFLRPNFAVVARQRSFFSGALIGLIRYLASLSLHVILKFCAAHRRSLLLQQAAAQDAARTAAHESSGAVRSRNCLLYTSPSPRDLSTSRMPSSA